jgi:hypothetical protein
VVSDELNKIKEVKKGILLFTTLCFCIAMQAQNKSVVQDNAMRLTVDIQNQGNVISPFLFGHNLEHTRRAIRQGLGAEMIANRQLVRGKLYLCACNTGENMMYIFAIKSRKMT